MNDKVEVKIDGDFLVIKVPLLALPKLSKSEKNRTIASTFGNFKSQANYKGKQITVGVNAYVPA